MTHKKMIMSYIKLIMMVLQILTLCKVSINHSVIIYHLLFSGACDKMISNKINDLVMAFT